MSTREADEARETVRQRYGQIAVKGGGAPAAAGQCCESKDKASCCEAAEPSCCGSAAADDASAKLGYSAEELAAAPEGANLGLGCGNPQAIAALQPGETVVDLGSGGGLDCFLAARQVGASGRVIGVDMTPEMIAKARENARQSGFTNVEFRLGEIEHLPVADTTVDVILSNCVINLSPDKRAVYGDAFRVLKPGGRLAISDVVRLKEFPQALKDDPNALCGCVAGSASVEELGAILAEAGFREIRVTVNAASREFISDWAPGTGIEEYIAAASVQAVRPPEGCEACAACDGL
ncbi:MAG: arsenite methyltransferase, partial [Armatimonadetes bacterium]|nr:arsenite methyltransferase [Armatimonadota bacterium]